MTGTPIECGSVSVTLNPSPINPDWILEGSPVARNSVLSRSRDGTACTLVWECTPGKFVWHYTTDETIHILEGRIVLDDGVEAPRSLGAGDVVFFPAGAVVRWTVEAHVRKLAFFRRQLPKPIALVTEAARRAKGLIRNRPTSDGMMGASRPGGMATSHRVETVDA
jgi:uncharacterized cupin superfamily protein